MTVIGRDKDSFGPAADSITLLSRKTVTGPYPKRPIAHSVSIIGRSVDGMPRLYEIPAVR